jgi:hypothetical protein
MRKIKILWTDDEVEALMPHIFFLEEKGYEIDTSQMEMILLTWSNKTGMI